MLIHHRFLNFFVGTDVRYDRMGINNCEACTDATSNEACTDATSNVFINPNSHNGILSPNLTTCEACTDATSNEATALANNSAPSTNCNFLEFRGRGRCSPICYAGLR